MPDDGGVATSSLQALDASYRALVDVVTGLTEAQSWAATGCAGWSVRDLVFHCTTDAQRALVALHTPTDRSPDRDAMSYWQDWAPGNGSPSDGRRFVRVVGSMFGRFDPLGALYAETALAVLRAASGSSSEAVVATQGHTLTIDDLASTLAVEATIHHLDLVVMLDESAPSVLGLAHTRTVLDRLLGQAGPTAWDDAYYAQVATGRIAPVGEELTALGLDPSRFPLLS